MNKEIKQSLCKHKLIGICERTATIVCADCNKKLGSEEAKDALYREMGETGAKWYFKHLELRELEIRAKLNYEKELKLIKIKRDAFDRRRDPYRFSMKRRKN